MPADLRQDLTRAVTGVSSEEQDEDEDSSKAWQSELASSKKFFDKWHKQADESIRRYLDDHGDMDLNGCAYRLNLYHSNVTILESMLYAKIPKVEADRRFFDPTDDVARVAAEMVTRILQNDMNDPEDKLDDVLRAALQDRLLTGLGCARVKYSMEEEGGDDEAGIPATKTDEWCDLLHVNWKDIRWSPARTAQEVRWKAFRAYMRKKEIRARFGDEIADAIPYSTNNSPRLTGEKSSTVESIVPEAEVWEIWSEEKRETVWVIEGYDKILDREVDMLGLDGFYPDARPMIANTTTAKYLPKPDFSLSKDLYDEIDELESRIAMLTKAVKCVGVYNRANKDVARMLTETVENQLVPVDNWAMFAESGGLKGAVDWLPIEAVVNAVNILTQQQLSRINQLYQVTGMSDIMRGQATTTGVTATEQKIKAQFGSARIQAVQDEFARFATDLLNKKVQLIQRYYDPQRIVELSNIQNTPDAPLIEQAVQLIKTPGAFNIRISIKSESMAQENLDAVREERTALIQGVSQFLGMAMPMIEMMPTSAPFLLQLLQFSIAGYKGASQMEGVIDQAIVGMEKALQEKAQQPQPPDPEQIKAQTEEKRLQMEGQMAQQTHQADMMKMQAELAQDKERFQLEMQQSQQEHMLRVKELEMKLQTTMMTAQIKMQADEHKAEIQHSMQEDKADSQQQMQEDKVASQKQMNKDKAAQAKKGAKDAT